MKVVFHEDFNQVYTSDPAAAAGRMESIVETIIPARPRSISRFEQNPVHNDEI